MDIGKHLTFMAQGANQVKKAPEPIVFIAGMKLIAGSNGENEIKIMAVVDGFIMARRKGCYPFVQSVKSFTITYIESCGYTVKSTKHKNKTSNQKNEKV